MHWRPQAAGRAIHCGHAQLIGMLHSLLLFGVTGDLAGRYLLPALGALHAAARLPSDFRVIGASTREWDDAALRRHAGEKLDRFAPDLPKDSRDALLGALHHRQIDLSLEGSLEDALKDVTQSGPLAAYLGLPVGFFSQALDRLNRASLPKGSRIAIEKPFGTDLASARELAKRTADFTRIHGERSIYLVDFLLGMAPLQNLLTLRRANPLLESAWRREIIDRVELHWEETLGLEGRAAYFDRAGMLRDVVQNHVMQLLAHVAMELPSNVEEPGALQQARLSAVRAIRPLTARDVALDTRRARYAKGVLRGITPDAPTRSTVAYLDEEGVDASRDTETFAQVLLWVDTPRWRGVPFVIRTGKALAQMRKEVVLHLRPALGFADAPVASRLRIGIDQPKDLELTLLGHGGGPSDPPAALSLCAPPPPEGLPAYARVLDDFLRQRSILAVSPDEALAAWEVVTPVLDGWARGDVPMETYPAGSSGPEESPPPVDAPEEPFDTRLPARVHKPELPRR